MGDEKGIELLKNLGSYNIMDEQKKSGHVPGLLLILVFLAALWYTLNRLTNLILTYNT